MYEKYKRTAKIISRSKPIIKSPFWRPRASNRSVNFLCCCARRIFSVITAFRTERDLSAKERPTQRSQLWKHLTYGWYVKRGAPHYTHKTLYTCFGWHGIWHAWYIDKVVAYGGWLWLNELCPPPGSTSLWNSVNGDSSRGDPNIDDLSTRCCTQRVLDVVVSPPQVLYSALHHTKNSHWVSEWVRQNQTLRIANPNMPQNSIMIMQ